MIPQFPNCMDIAIAIKNFMAKPIGKFWNRKKVTTGKLGPCRSLFRAVDSFSNPGVLIVYTVPLGDWLEKKKQQL